MAEPALRVRIARVSDDDATHEAAPRWMGAAERRRWATSIAAARPAFVASRRLLRDALAEATGLPADGWQVSAEAGTAPFASHFDAERGVAPQVSIAHRLGWVAVAVGPADGGAIGVDIECERPARSDSAARAALVMQGDELARWQALDAGEREPALLRAWIAREAWCKAAGAGAPWDFRRLACRPCDAADANVRIWEAGTVRVALCARHAGALAAAACEGWAPGSEVRSSSCRVGVAEAAPAGA